MSSHASIIQVASPVIPSRESVAIGESFDVVTDYSQLTVVVPTLNEEGNIGELLDYLLYHYPGLHVIVADDDSTDRTREEVMARARFNPRVQLLWRRECVRGLTASVLDAIKQVTTEYFAVMDGDLQHPPEVVRRLMAALQAGASLVVATRQRFKVAPHRWLISKVATVFGRLRLRLSGAARCTDCMSGFFAGQARLIRQVIQTNEQAFELGGYKVLFDLLKQLPRSTDVREIGYEFDPRHRGQSKISSRIIWLYLCSLFH